MSDIHEQLMTLFRKYFEANQDWEMHRTHAAGKRCRSYLLEIRKIAHDRRIEIQAIREEKPKLKSPAYKQKKLQELAQKKKAQDDPDTN